MVPPHRLHVIHDIPARRSVNYQCQLSVGRVVSPGIGLRIALQRHPDAGLGMVWHE